MRSAVLHLATFAMIALHGGCAMHQVKFSPSIHCAMPPTERATEINGTIEEAEALAKEAELPHNSLRDKYLLYLLGMKSLTDQLGSDEYMLIGSVHGTGNGYANHASLTEALCRKASERGGDVVLVFQRDTSAQPFSFTTPGRSTTNMQASAYDYGNYATAYGTSNTTYYPGQTYSGVIYRPSAGGLVFKHVPGAPARREAIMRLSDGSLEDFDKLQESLIENRKITFDEMLRIIDEWLENESTQ